MRVVQFRSYGPPEVLHLGARDVPEPGPGEIRVRVAAVGVNPADAKWRQGMFRDRIPLSLPHVPGYDVAGTVDAIGKDVTNLSLGDRVTGMTNPLRGGAYAEYALLAAQDAAPIGDQLDFDRACTLPTAGLTGVQLIEDHVCPQRGQTVLITGALGAVGRHALFAALGAGADIVAAVRPGQEEAAGALGADASFPLGLQDWSGPPFDHIVDTLGGEEVAQLCLQLKLGGLIRTVATTPIPAEHLREHPVRVSVHPDGVRLARLASDMAAGRVDMPISRRLPLDDSVKAHQLIEAGGVGGKIVLCV